MMGRTDSLEKTLMLGNIEIRRTIQKMKTMTSSPITSWQIEGEEVEAETDFIFLGSKITVDSGCGHEIKGHMEEKL